MTDALFSLVAGEGDGAILALAAGDTAGAAWDLGYSAVTQQATVISYSLIANGRLDFDQLTSSLLELDGAMDEDPVFRAESPEFRSWLDGARSGSASPDETPSLDPMGRSAPLGVSYRSDPETMCSDVIALNRLFHSDAASIAAAVATTAAVAASCFGQGGRDLLLGVAETVSTVLDQLLAAPGLVGTDSIDGFDQRIRELVVGYGRRGAKDVLDFVVGDEEPGPLESAMAVLLLCAPAAERPHEPIAEAARVGGSNLGAAAGAMIGARIGIRAWPWAFANDTWFAEIGRRLVRGPQEVRDLPIPYAVEQHLISGLHPDQV